MTTLNKVNVIGEQAWHVFKSDADGSILTQECPVAEYDSLQKPNSKSPSLTGYTWTHSYKDWKYDTTSGRLEPMCYVEYQGKFIANTGRSQEGFNSLPEAVASISSLTPP